MTTNTLTDLIPDLYAALDIVSRELVGMIPAVTFDGGVSRADFGVFTDDFLWGRLQSPLRLHRATNVATHMAIVTNRALVMNTQTLRLATQSLIFTTNHLIVATLILIVTTSHRILAT